MLYPHVLTGVLSARSAEATRRNAAALPVFALVLGLIALLGYAAIAIGVDPKVGSSSSPTSCSRFSQAGSAASLSPRSSSARSSLPP